VPNLEEMLQGSSVIDAEFKFDLIDYLAQYPNAPVKSIADILESGRYHPSLGAGLRRRNAIEARDTDAYRRALAKRSAVQQAVVSTMTANKLAALAYPVVRRKPALIGQPQVGSNCQLSASTGLPAMSAPAGFTSDGLPVGVELLGGQFSEPELLKLAYAYEEAVRPRRPPVTTPPLADERPRTP
jgi:amidase